MRQPVPRLGEDDLSRVVERDFNDPVTATALLAEATDSLSLRAKVATAKLSGGSIEKLRSQLHQAEVDERDVIAWAEYPRYMMAGPSGDRELLDQAVSADWDEYQSWLNAAAPQSTTAAGISAASHEIEFLWKEEVVYWEGSRGCVFPGAWGGEVLVTIVPDDASWDAVVPLWMKGRRPEIVERLEADSRHRVRSEQSSDHLLDERERD